MSEVKQAKISDIQLDDHNANQGTQRGLGMLDSSLRKHGAGRSVLLDRQGRAIAGNKTIERAVDVGIEDVIIVKTNGRQLVAVQREDLDLDDPATGARELAYYDNRTGEADLSWNPDVILADFEAGAVDFSQLWNEAEWSALLEGFGSELLGRNGAGGDAAPQVDRAAELQAVWGTQVGQVWQLGEHRLAIGDCTDKATVEAVMRGDRAQACITDPPYGVGKAEWDDIFPGLEVWEYHRNQLAKGANVIIFPGEVNLPLKVKILFEVFTYQWPVIWYKPNAMQFGKTGYSVQSIAWWLSVGEPVTKPKFRDVIVDAIVPKNNDFGHPSPKNLNVIIELVEQFTDGKSLVYEPYLGSGTTLIACENLTRRCRAIEIDPGYAAVSLQRWTDATGRQPERVSG